MSENSPLIDSSLLFQAPWQRWLYKPLQGALEAGLGLRRLNRLYERVGGRGLEPAAFCQAALEDLGVTWSVNPEGLHALQAVQGPCLVVANHPVGGREALILHCLLTAARRDYRIIANYLLGEIPETLPKLILVDPYETKAAARANVRAMLECVEWMKAGGLLGVFPAGEVAYWQPQEGRIADKPWAPQAVRLALKARATLVPLHFSGHNGALFNFIGRVRPLWKSAFLGQQLAFGPSRHIQATLGEPLPYESLPHRDQPALLAAWLREKVYQLA